MKLESKIAALEKASTGKLCTVQYKWGCGPAGEVEVPLDKALQEARAGKLKHIDFPLTFNEEQTERLHKTDALAEIFESIEGIKRDSHSPDCGNLLLCSKPIVYARQAPPRGGVGGNLITEDGTPFHQTEWRDILAKYNAGFIIVLDYDEAKEPWYGRN